MSAEDNKALYRRFQEVLQSGDLSALDEIVAVDVVDYSMPAGTPHGRESFKEVRAKIDDAFPDARATIEDLIAEGDKVVARLMVRGTHQGTFHGIAPTAKPVNFCVIDIVRVEGGRIVGRWNVWDMFHLLQQLGALRLQTL